MDPVMATNWTKRKSLKSLSLARIKNRQQLCANSKGSISSLCHSPHPLAAAIPCQPHTWMWRGPPSWGLRLGRPLRTDKQLSFECGAKKAFVTYVHRTGNRLSVSKTKRSTRLGVGFWKYLDVIDWSQWQLNLRRWSAAARLLGLRVRIQSEAWKSVSCKRCALSDRGLCDGLITRPEESYRCGKT